MFTLRPYQKEALHGGRGYPGVYAALEEKPSTLLVMATGTGKTVVFIRAIMHCVKLGKKALVVAHRRELIHQAQGKVITSGLDASLVGVEMAQERSSAHHQVVVGSVQTLTKTRLEKNLDPSEFGLVVIDEAHHAVAKSYQRILEHFADHAKLLGVTATPDRLDGKGLGKVFESVAYVYEIIDGLADGYLVREDGGADKILGEVIFDKSLDFSAVRTTAGDLNAGDLAKVMEGRQALAVVAKATVEKAADRPTLVFAVTVEQTRAIAHHINLIKPGSAAAIDGTIADRRIPPNLEQIAIAGTGASSEGAEWMRGGEGESYRDWLVHCLRFNTIQFVVNCALFTEGVDLPMVSCVAVARPTKSRALYAQMIGRGTRLHPDKRDLYILDFAGVSGRHKLVTSLDVLDGNTDAKVRRRAMKQAMAGPIPVQQTLDKVAAEIIEQERRRALREAKYRSVAMANPFAILGVTARPGRGGGRPATRDQLERLKRHKIPGAARQLRRLESGKAGGGLDWHQAQEIISAIGRRSRDGLCTVRMSMQLMKHGLNPDAPFEVAEWAMEQLRGNAWRPTSAMMEHPKLQPKGEQA